MLYREIGTSGVKASCVAFGTWELAGNVWGAVTEEEAIKTIHAALDGGITMIDTAASFGGDRREGPGRDPGPGGAGDKGRRTF